MAADRALAVALALAAAVAAGCRSAPKAPASESGGFRLVVLGNQALSLGEILSAAEAEVAALEENGWRKSDLDDLAFEVERAYRERGFDAAVVDYEHDAAGERAVLRIVEGPRVFLEDVVFSGNEAIPSDDLESALGERRAGFLGLSGRIFVRNDVESWPAAIEDLYVERGYPQAEVAPPVIEISGDGTSAAVRLEITEGRKWVVAGLLIDDLPGLDAAKLREAVRPFDGVPWVARRAVEIRGAVLEVYAQSGYPDAEVKTSEAVSDLVDGIAEVRYAVSAVPGPQVRIGEVRLSGCEDVDLDFARSRVRLEPGDVYDARLVRESFRRLFGTGLFRSVDLRLKGEGEVRDLEVTVREGSSLEFFFEVGFGSYDLLRAKTGVRDRNLFDSSLIGRAELVGSIRGAQLTLGVTDPWFLRTEFSADLPIRFLRREEPAFTIQEVGVEPRLSYPLSDQLTAGWTYRFDLSRIERIEADDEDLDEERRLRVGASGPFFILDDRDNLFAPRSGGITRGSLEFGDEVLGGEISFLRSAVSTARFLEIGDGTVLASALRSEWIRPVLGTRSIPIQERLFNGGENSVRSFREGELGPEDGDGDPIGGEVSNFLSAEFRQRILGEFSLALFYDTGNVAEKTSRPFVGFRHAVGAGLRYLLPIGPLRIDVGVNPDPRDGEDDYVIQVAVGMPY